MSARLHSNRHQKLASVAAARLANRETPLIHNAWYVAARGTEISREFMERWSGDYWDEVGFCFARKTAIR